MAETVMDHARGRVVVVIDSGDVQYGLARRMVEILEAVACTGDARLAVAEVRDDRRERVQPPVFDYGAALRDMFGGVERLPPPDRPWLDQRRCRPRKLRRWGPRRLRR